MSLLKNLKLCLVFLSTFSLFFKMAQNKRINKYLEDEIAFLSEYFHHSKEEVKGKMYLEYKKAFPESTKIQEAVIASQKWYELKKQAKKNKKRQSAIKKTGLGASRSSSETNQGKLF